jgi:hypothetical protein
VSSRRCTILVALLLTTLSVLAGGVPATAADDDSGLQVAITSLDPTLLAPGRDVTMTGTVTNSGRSTWSAAQAYLVIPASPFTTRGQIDQAVSGTNAYTGVRVVDPGTFDEMGDLAPGQTLGFSIQVPYEQLGITGAEGVYPVGVQILATDDEGIRSATAVGRATTFLPLVSAARELVPTSIVWPFLMPDRRGADGDYVDAEALITAVGAGGRLRNLLDLAASTPADGATVVIDPALLVGVDDVARGRHVPEGLDVSEEQKAAATTFLTDLLVFTRSRSPWILDYDRTDVLALSQNADLAAPLKDAIDRVTEQALARYQLSGRRLSWPTRSGVTSELLADLRGNGDRPVIVTRRSLPDWQQRLGTLVQVNTDRGPVPLLVDDNGDGRAAGQESVVTLRQRLLGEASLAVIERTRDPRSRADAVVIVDPQWNPGSDWAAGDLSTAFAAPFAQPTNLDAALTQSLSTYSGTVPSSTRTRPVSRDQLRVATDLVAQGRLLGSVIADGDGVDVSVARSAAELLGVRWRRHGAEGLSVARARAKGAAARLDKISIEAPPSVTLSSSKGGFPLTIRNDTDEAIRIGVDLDSSNPALTIPSVESVAVAAGERRTLTVQIDLGNQRTTFLTAHLTAGDGRSVGDAEIFKVRSSSISTVLWVAMGAAGVFVLMALARRFHRRRTGTRAEQAAGIDG